MHTSIRRLAMLSVALTSWSFAAPATFAADKVFDKKFAVSPGGTLNVDTANGSLTVSGADVREVTIYATLSGSENMLRDFEITAEQDRHGVSVHGTRAGGWWLDMSWLFGSNFRVKYDIQVPREYALELHTSGGNIDARNLQGNVNAHTSGGDIKLASVVGAVDLHTSGGDIQASQVTGNALLRTSGGGITATDTSGELDLRTSGGTIHLQNVEGKVSARTSGGNIDASMRGANLGSTLRTSGGNIVIAVPSDFKATIDAHTSGGRVSCDLPLSSSDRDSDRNDLRGNINGGGPTMIASSSGGNIRIRQK